MLKKFIVPILEEQSPDSTKSEQDFTALRFLTAIQRDFSDRKFPRK
jgi:hypothetical protein